MTARALGTVPGAPLGYLEYLPPGYGDGTLRPLLVAFHGSGESGNGSARALAHMVETGVPRVIYQDQWPADRPFVVLMPQHEAGPGRPACFTAQEVGDFLEFARQNYQVDPRRIYITGYSCGAIGSWDYLGLHTNEVVAGAVPIAGDGRDAFARAGCRLGLVPIWAFHGGADPIVDPNGSIDTIKDLLACTDPPAVDVELNVFPGIGHAMWQPIYDGSLHIDIYDWLLSHTHA